VTYPGFTPVGNATLVVANVLTCNKHSQIKHYMLEQVSHGELKHSSCTLKTST
jgi:hypothetical protein